MPIPPVAAIPATPHEESVKRLFAHRLQPVKMAEQPQPPKAVEPEQREITEMQRALDEFLLKRYRYHPPKPDQIPRYEAVRAAVLQCATVIVANAPPSNEMEEALTALDAAMMFANAAIARNS